MNGYFHLSERIVFIEQILLDMSCHGEKETELSKTNAKSKKRISSHLVSLSKMNSLGYDQSPEYASMEMSQETHLFVQLMSYNNYRKNVTSLSRGGEQNKERE